MFWLLEILTQQMVLYYLLLHLPQRKLSQLFLQYKEFNCWTLLFDRNRIVLNQRFMRQMDQHSLHMFNDSN